MKNEPAVTVGAGVAIAAVVLGLIAFALFNSQQQAAVLGLLAVLAPIVTGVVTRRHVTPKSKVEVR